MIQSEIRHFRYTNGDRQRVELVKFDSFDELDFIMPEGDPAAFEKLCTLYQNFFIKQMEVICGQVIIYRIPDDLEVPFAADHKQYGHLLEKLTVVTARFKDQLYAKGGQVHFKDQLTKQFYHRLEEQGCLKIAKGKLDRITLLPVSNRLGFLSSLKEGHELLVNGGFFVMMHFDCDSIYDQVGTPIGLCVKNGHILQPPLFDREVLMVQDGKVSIGSISLKDLTIRVGDRWYQEGVNCYLYSRPKTRITPSGGVDLVILNERVVAVKANGRTVVPSGGFILKCEQMPDLTERTVRYEGCCWLDFAIQVGNSTVVNGQRTERFISPFCHILEFWKPTYPPATYPLNYQKDRAPRIVLGADGQNRPMLVWLEGAGKFGYQAGKDSCGASLWESSAICQKLGMTNGIHLDGGGSAQILIKGQRHLKISDRRPEDYGEVERAIAMGLTIKEKG